MLFAKAPFSSINIDDPFFDSLKSDYPGSATSTGFLAWFHRKAKEGAKAFVAQNETGVYAFIYVKQEAEEIHRQDGTSLPEENRIKIGTFRIAESQQGQRLGEGAVGLVHWIWQTSMLNTMYVTVFEKQIPLINLFKKFGFKESGKNLNGELILVKDKWDLDFSDPYKSYPFIKSGNTSFGYLCINDEYHDTMFPYSNLHGKPENLFEKCVSNGISKIYVGNASQINHSVGDIVFIYRVNKNRKLQSCFTSCLTSFATVTNIIVAKSRWRNHLSFEDCLKQIRNKSVFDIEELRRQYNAQANFNIIELLYLGYFGEGNNINNRWLTDQGLWCEAFGKNYPTEIKLPQESAIHIFNKAAKNPSTILL